MRLLPLPLLFLATMAAAAPGAEPDDTDAPVEPQAQEPSEPSEPSEAKEDPLRRLPTPAEGARKAPVVERPPGVPEGWTEVPLGPAPTVSEGEIVVWGTAAIRQAKAALLRAMADQGWEVRRRREGEVVFKGPEPWMGSARISDDGLVAFKRRLVWFEPVRQVASAPMDGMNALERTGPRAYPGTTTRGGLGGPISKTKHDAVVADVLQGLDAELRAYRTVLAETALQQRLHVLPDRLDALWREGRPMEGGPWLETPDARRAAVLDYWATRPDSREGALVCQTVEAWISQVMQASDAPATPQELDAAAGRRADGRYPLARRR